MVKAKMQILALRDGKGSRSVFHSADETLTVERTEKDYCMS